MWANITIMVDFLSNIDPQYARERDEWLDLYNP